MTSVLEPTGARVHNPRVGLFILFSFLVHAAFLGAFPSLTNAPVPEPERAERIRVDLVSFAQPEALEPASLAPAVAPTVAPPKQAAVRKPAPPPGEYDSPRRQPEKERARPPDPPDNLQKHRDRDIPPVRDLIPSMQNLLALQQASAHPLRALDLGAMQDGARRLPAETHVEPYLLLLKHRVERNWKVSPDRGTREGVTVVYAIVNGDGSLFSCDIIQPSGMLAHDFQAREAVVQTFPLSPPPQTLLNEKGILPIRFSFHYLLAPVS